MKNFIKEVLVILTVLICSVIYTRYYLLYESFAVLKSNSVSFNTTNFIFDMWIIVLPYTVVILWVIFLTWQIFSLFKKIQRNYILLVLSIVVLGFVFYIDNPDIIEMIKYSKEDNDLVIYPPLSGLGEERQPPIRDILIDEFIKQLRGIEVILGCLCLFLVYRIYQNNRNVFN
jgi:hypothetical protein